MCYLQLAAKPSISTWCLSSGSTLRLQKQVLVLAKEIPLADPPLQQTRRR